MRPTWEGLLFRTFRLLFLITVIVGFFSACLSSVETMRGPAGPGPVTPSGPLQAPNDPEHQGQGTGQGNQQGNRHRGQGGGAPDHGR